MTRIISVISSHRGAGKTTISAVIASYFAKKSLRTCLLSFELTKGHRNNTIGVTPHFDLVEKVGVSDNRKEMVLKGPHGFDIIAGGYDIGMMDDEQFTHMADFDVIIDGLDEYDIIVLDTPYGVTRPAIVSALACSELVYVLTPEEEYLEKSFELLKILKENGYMGSLSLVLNKSISKKKSKKILAQFRMDVDHLDITVVHTRHIPFDEDIKLGFSEGDVLGSLTQNSNALKEINQICDALSDKTSEHSFIPDSKIFWQQFAMISQLPMPFIDEINPNTNISVTPEETPIDDQEESLSVLPPSSERAPRPDISSVNESKTLPVIPMGTESIDYLLTRIADSLNSISIELSSIRHLITDKSYDTMNSRCESHEEKIYLEFEKYLDKNR